jgi:hypothetical protein
MLLAFCCPVPGQQRVQFLHRVIGDAGQHVAKPGLWIDMVISLAVPIREYIAAARSPPRPEPANSEDNKKPTVFTMGLVFDLIE